MSLLWTSSICFSISLVLFLHLPKWLLFHFQSSALVFWIFLAYLKHSDPRPLIPSKFHPPHSSWIYPLSSKLQNERVLALLISIAIQQIGPWCKTSRRTKGGGKQIPEKEAKSNRAIERRQIMVKYHQQNEKTPMVHLIQLQKCGTEISIKCLVLLQFS